MNTKKLLLTVFTAAVTSTAAPSFADRYHDEDGFARRELHQVIDRDEGTGKSNHRFKRYLERRHIRQLSRIAQGIDSGELTRNEARKLKRQQQRIARIEKQVSSDRHYSSQERRILEAELGKASDAIYRKKHNDRVRTYRYSDGLWKPSQRSNGRREDELNLGLILYPGRGFPFWW